MDRITITIDEALLATIDALVAEKGYGSRSEAIRDLVRAAAKRDAAPELPCIATLSYVYDHAVRGLAQRLAQAQHDHHDLVVAIQQVQLDHQARLEIVVLRGPSDAVRRFADSVTSQRGVRHHALHLVPARLEETRHDHGAGAHRHLHVHA
ncbi:nickel-responsive transcriptional regulator NikR [Roseicella frigidaeris]|uniref:Putative nickel-responsive regulator n=1 Tax=Roseicella frigidaeris TaxID=2230885 RepID=A0A327MBP3_9PROT|nr:nickel-responsive transcriptional regulator NikR [Roseicella frigidaeris]RAI59977.1 nickel-responsive transcriptional regulator NikR [Roseicella frigidaeris]